MKNNSYLVSLHHCFFAMGLIAIFGCGSETAFESELIRELPNGSRVLQEGIKRGGPDSAFAYKISGDRKTVDRFVDEWSLSPSSEPPSFYLFAKSQWWPSEHALKEMPVKYEWLNQADEEYRSLWFRPSRNEIYIEYGGW